MNIVRMRVLGVVFFLGACASASGADNPDGKAAVGETGNAYCRKLESCGIVTDVAGCVSTLEAKVPAGAKDSCSQAQIDTCTRDIEKMVCTDAVASKMPASCGGC